LHDHPKDQKPELIPVSLVAMPDKGENDGIMPEVSELGFLSELSVT